MTIGLIKLVIRNLGIPSWYPEYPDLLDIGQHACEIARQSFDESKSSLDHWMYLKIRWYIINYYKNHSTKIKHLEEDMSLDEEGSEYLAVIFSFEPKLLDELTIESIIKTMPERTQIILQMYYWEGLRFNEIGEILHIPQTAVYAVHKRALRKLRRRMEFKDSNNLLM
jgi:RNA polymerase sigma factor (sigma-70 family)